MLTLFAIGMAIFASQIRAGGTTNAFIGCYKSISSHIPGFDIGASTLHDCVEGCSGMPYAYFYEAAVKDKGLLEPTCWCGTSQPPIDKLVFGDDRGNCTEDSFQGYARNVLFSFEKCYLYTTGPPDGGHYTDNLAGPNKCFSQCHWKQVTLLFPQTQKDGKRIWRCGCGEADKLGVHETDCGPEAIVRYVKQPRRLKREAAWRLEDIEE